LISTAQIDLVQTSFDKIRPEVPRAADLFYDRLFSQAPQIRPLFSKDLSEQKKMFMAVLGTSVAGLGRFEKIAPALQELGRRHVAYGVKPSHYAIIGDALLWSMAAVLGDSFTADVEEAWSDAYADLASAMINASAGPAIRSA
jgi:hemoglobin-like flavoprotein